VFALSPSSRQRWAWKFALAALPVLASCVAWLHLARLAESDPLERRRAVSVIRARARLDRENEPIAEWLRGRAGWTSTDIAYYDAMCARPSVVSIREWSYLRSLVDYDAFNIVESEARNSAMTLHAALVARRFHLGWPRAPSAGEQEMDGRLALRVRRADLRMGQVADALLAGTDGNGAWILRDDGRRYPLPMPRPPWNSPQGYGGIGDGPIALCGSFAALEDKVHPPLAGRERVEVRIGRRRLLVLQTEVAVGDYGSYCRLRGLSVPAQPEGSSRHYPVVGVTWAEAKSFAEAVGGRLPTASEWKWLLGAKRTGASRSPWVGTGISRAWPGGEASTAKPPSRAGGMDRTDRCPKGIKDLLGGVAEWLDTKVWQPEGQEAPGGHPRPDLRFVGCPWLAGAAEGGEGAQVACVVRDGSAREPGLGFRVVWDLAEGQ
jgi:hypothetical protein